MPTDLSQFGVTTLTANRPRRMILSIESAEGCGKTSLALDAPGPTLIINLDRNTEGLLGKYISAGKHIDELRLNIQRDSKAIKLVVGSESRLALKTEDQQASNECIKYHSAQYKRFLDCYTAALADGFYRTIVIDSGTDLNELLKLATFGRVEQVPANLYTLLNADWAELFNRAKDQQHANLIITHKYKDEWVEKIDEKGFKVSKPTGKQLTAAWKGMAYAVQARVALSLENGLFMGRVVRGVDAAGKLMEISGEKFQVPAEGSWPMVCGLLTGEWDWE